MPKKKHKILKYIWKALVWILKLIFVDFLYFLFSLIIKFLFRSAKDKIKKSLINPGIKSNPVYKELTVKDTTKGNFENFEKRLLNSSLIIAIAGRRGSGKSTLGFRILENIATKTKRKAFVLDVPQNVMPSFITSVNNLDEVKNNSVLLVDEGALAFSSRNAMTKDNKALADLLAIARHKDLTLILVTQNTSMIDKNVLNLCDTVLLKEGSLLQEKMERPVLRDLYKQANNEFNKLNKNEVIKHFFIFDSDFEGLCSYELPSFWSDRISKSRA